MSVDSPQPGEITLHGLVSLENRRPAPGKPNTYIYDVIFSCSGQTTDGIASCRHYIGQDRTKKLDDVYDVRAKIVSFKGGRNVNSDQYCDDAINLLGEIRTMQPLSSEQEDDLDETIRISAFGSVTSINNDPAYFIMHATQYVAGGQSSDDIAIRAELFKNPKWPNPSERLPQPKAVVGIWGKLDQIDGYTFAGTKKTTCLVVDVEEISYLYNPKRDPAEKPSTPTKKKSSLQERFKKRTRNRNTSPLSSPSTSQTQLGKRRAGSEDEVDDRV